MAAGLLSEAKMVAFRFASFISNARAIDPALRETRNSDRSPEEVAARIEETRDYVQERPLG
jgi:hypothetical protein